ncbi:MAG: thioredoxin domain-containing protein [Acidobacteria bacterium]|nr:thioredoxin domain-containing protein [Acidobacteriota bacterium]MBI3484098.1 thioredoxin domain-containing protein [Acidobacteriota bacterium]
MICTALLVLGMGGHVAAQTPAKRPSATKSAAQIDITPLKALGTKGAPITMEVFSDFQCPACRELYFQTVRPVIDNYVSAGKVYLIHRDNPLQQHPHSREAARYANAAARVRKMEKVVIALFDKQAAWTADGNIDGVVASALTPAEMNQVRKLVRSGTLDAGIDKDLALGTQFRVTQTPTTIITYKGQTYPVVGVVSYNMLKTFLEQLLKQ